MNIKNPTGKKEITVKKGEKITISLQDFEPGNRAFELTIKLEGENAECHVEGRCQTTAKDEKKWKIQQIFEGESQTGTINIRGTGEDQSRFQCDAQAILEKSSKQATANISERVILFDEARSKLLPVLTVKTDDVASAAHGATVAPVEPEKIAYLQSRGISKKQAEQMIKEGFLL